MTNPLFDFLRLWKRYADGEIEAPKEFAGRQRLCSAYSNYLPTHDIFSLNNISRYNLKLAFKCSGFENQQYPFDKAHSFDILNNPLRRQWVDDFLAGTVAPYFPTTSRKAFLQYFRALDFTASYNHKTKMYTVSTSLQRLRTPSTRTALEGAFTLAKE